TRRRRCPTCTDMPARAVTSYTYCMIDPRREPWNGRSALLGLHRAESRECRRRGGRIEEPASGRHRILAKAVLRLPQRAKSLGSVGRRAPHYGRLLWQARMLARLIFLL